MTDFGSLDSRQRDALRFLGPDDTSEPSSPRVGPGAVFGEFEVIEELGRGGFGIVFRAHQRSLDREVALKVVALPPALDTGPYHGHLAREAKLLAALDHPAVVRVHAAGVATHCHWVAMELVEGGTLADWLETTSTATPRHLATALRKLADVAAGLGAAHSHGIVHRDVKPANVLLDRDGRARIADFGLARPESRRDDSQTAGFVGTPRFASPEQVRGEPATTRSDVFSLGATLFAAIYGVHPFAAKGSRLITEIERAEPQYPPQPRTSDDLRAVLETCLHADSDRRYANATEVAAELERVLRLEPVLARRRTRFERASIHLRRALRRPTIAASAAGLLVALAIAVWLGIGSWQAGRRERIDADFRSAANAMRAMRTAEARTLLQGILSEDPNRNDAWSLLGECRLRDGEPGLATAAFGRVLTTPEARYVDHAGAAVAAGPPRVPIEEAAEWPKPITARDLAMRASLLHRSGEFAAAAESARSATELEPDAAMWRREFGERLLWWGRFSKALEQARAAHAQNSSDSETARLVARALQSLDRWDEAETFIEARALVMPNDPELLRIHVRTLLGVGRDAEARELVGRLLEEANGEPSELLALDAIDVLAATEELELAEQLCDQLEARHGVSHYSLTSRLTIARQRGGGEDGLAAAERAAEVAAPVHRIDALHVLAWAQRRRGDYAAAAESYRELEKLRPETSSYVYFHAFCRLHCGDTEDAERIAADAVTRGVRNPRLYAVRAEAARLEGRTFDALFAYEQALGTEPTEAFGAGTNLYWIVRLWLDLDEPRVALLHCEKLLELQPRWSRTWSLLAGAHTGLGDHSAAANAFARAVELEDLPAIRADYADSLFQAGRETEALAQFQRARQDDPTVATAWCGEAILRIDAADPSLRYPAEAVRLMLRAVELDPDNEAYAGYLRRAREAAGQSK